MPMQGKMFHAVLLSVAPQELYDRVAYPGALTVSGAKKAGG